MPRERAWSSTDAAWSRGMSSHVRQDPSAKRETSTPESPSSLRGTATSGALGADALAQQRQDVAGELLHVARLLVAREVEHQLGEPEVDVGADALGDVLGIVGDDEAAAGAVGVLVGQPLHLDRVLHAGLLLTGEGERRPPAAGLLGALLVVVVGDLDLDHVRDLRGVAPGLLCALGDAGEQGAVEVGVLAARADEP